MNRKERRAMEARAKNLEWAILTPKGDYRFTKDVVGPNGVMLMVYAYRIIYQDSGIDWDDDETLFNAMYELINGGFLQVKIAFDGKMLPENMRVRAIPCFPGKGPVDLDVRQYYERLPPQYRDNRHTRNR